MSSTLGRYLFGPSLRIECHIPGADANPYILYAAAELPKVPATLREAISELERSDMAKEAFGEDVFEHYLHFLRTEQRKFDEVVTCWERARYFERA